MEELIQDIQSGNNERLSELWENTEKLVHWWANRLIKKMPPYVTYEDIIQCGYPAMCEAVRTYDTNKGSWGGWFGMYLRSAVAKLGGYGKKRDPLCDGCLSLDAPIKEDENLLFLDTIADDSEPYAATEDAIFNEQLHDALEEALTVITDLQRKIIHERYYNNRTVTEIANEKDCKEIRKQERKALKHLKRCKYAPKLRTFLDEITPWYMSVGVSAFQNTHTSAVELIAMKREKIAEKYV